MKRPTIILDHPSTLAAAIGRGELQGPMYCAMAGETRWTSSPRVETLAPHYEDLVKIRTALERIEAGEITAHQMEINLAWYRRRCEAKWEAEDPGAFALDRLGIWDQHGAFCECAKPGSPKWRHPCHLTILVPFLVRDGADVVLYGRRITVGDLDYDGTVGPIFEHQNEHDPGTAYDPAVFGWPPADLGLAGSGTAA